MKKICLFILLVLCLGVNAQITPLYVTGFDNLPTDTAGWRHYAISGTDDWGLGTPTLTAMAPFTAPNAWKTNLTGAFAASSNRALESPSFDFTNLPADQTFSFVYKTQSNTATVNAYLEYSINNGASWALLDNTNMLKKTWQTSTGFGYNNYLSYFSPCIRLNFLQGQANVKFRFRYTTSTSTSGNGWMIDNVYIGPERYNMYATLTVDTLHATKYCSDLIVKSLFGFENQYAIATPTVINYYISPDNVLDGNDLLFGTYSFSATGTIQNLSRTFPMVTIPAGQYYLFYKYDAANTLVENIETDNVGHSILFVDSVYAGSYHNDFDNYPVDWVTENSSVWQLGTGTVAHIDGVHSGNNAWFTGRSIETTAYDPSLLSPFFDLTTFQNPIISFWYKKNSEWTSVQKIQYNYDCGTPSTNWGDLISLPENEDDEWDYNYKSLAAFATRQSIRFRVKFASDVYDPEGIAFDDVYIGSPKPDLVMERDKLNRFTSTLVAADTLKYMLANGCIAAAASNTVFYWSTDSILDGNDILLGTKAEQAMGDTTKIWTAFSYTKPTTTAGKYYILYALDSGNAIDEIWEQNNTGYFVLYQTTPVNVPYSNDFETQITGWRHNSTLGADDLKWAVINKPILNTAFSGVKAWVTNDTGSVTPLSRYHLYTPVFNINTVEHPVLEFDMRMALSTNLTNKEVICNMSYSVDGGATWIILDTTSTSHKSWYRPIEFSDYNGFDRAYYSQLYGGKLFAVSEPIFIPTFSYNGRDSERSTRYNIDLTGLQGHPVIQFRFNIGTSNTNSTLQEGLIIDNFKITNGKPDLTVKYKKALMYSSLATQLPLTISIKNQGNYISAEGQAYYYLSVDTLLDTGTDHFLGMRDIPAVRPDVSHYARTTIPCGVPLANYRYLIYSLDNTNTSAEFDETNNVGYWPLGLDSISQFPYVENFEDTILQGWREYCKSPSGIDGSIGFRFRNMLAPHEPVYGNGSASGRLFTDYVDGVSVYNGLPYFYIETPAFDFSTTDSIVLSFGLACTGQSSVNYKDGGNMHYSIDGTATWNVLTRQYFYPSLNWYNYGPLNNLNGLNNEPGWTGFYQFGTDQYLLDSTAINLSNLRGHKSVVLRYQYRSDRFQYNNRPEGMHIDNFTIVGYKLDYIVDSTLTDIIVSSGQTTLPLNYTIENSGQIQGRVSLTSFYWSTDSILDSSDSLLFNAATPVIAANTVYTNVANITLPTPITAPVGYILYKADRTFAMNENNENNNIGRYRLIFSSNANYLPLQPVDSIAATINNPIFTLNYNVVNNGFSAGLLSQTKFYWSPDSLLDGGDANITSSAVNAVNALDTTAASVTITYPTPVTQANYYLFYELDGNNAITEVFENDNSGRVKVMFDYVNGLHDATANNLQLYYSANKIFINSPTGRIGNNTLKITNLLGQVLYTTQLTIAPGMNITGLPATLANGLYIVILQGNEGSLSQKIIIAE